MQNFIRIALFAFVLLISVTDSSAQRGTKTIEIGIENQVYPTGFIPGLRIEKFLSNKSAINFRLGYQIINHRDIGVQDMEEGTGYGLSIGYRYFFGKNNNGLSIGVRADAWKNTIDWETNKNTGTSNILVLQPTAIAEFVILAADRIAITPSIAFGYEWNTMVEGEPTGQGAIFLVGVTAGLRF